MPSRRDTDSILRRVARLERIPFDEVTIVMRFRPSREPGHMQFEYTLEFTSPIEHLYFAVAADSKTLETLDASISLITEMTTLQGGESLADADEIVRRINVATIVDGRKRPLHFDELGWSQIINLAEQPENLRRETFRLFSTQIRVGEMDAALRPSRAQIRMTRLWPIDSGCVPWHADRLLFLRSLTADFTEVSGQLTVEPHFFFGRYGDAGRSVGPDEYHLRLEINDWMVAGHGFMFLWRSTLDQ